MNLLAVDTSTTSCSVAFFNGDRLLAEEIYTAGQTHSRHLLTIIHRILDACRCDPAGVTGIAVTRGPGTFTGLRIGISTIKGLATAIGAPVVGVSSLSALAFPFRRFNHPVVAMIDARRGEIYHAHFRGRVNRVEPIRPAAVGAPEMVAMTLPEDAVLVGSGAVLYQQVFADKCATARLADTNQHVIRAASVGRLALGRFLKDDVDGIDTLIPEYIRKSDAQIQLSASC